MTPRRYNCGIDYCNKSEIIAANEFPLTIKSLPKVSKRFAICSILAIMSFARKLNFVSLSRKNINSLVKLPSFVQQKDQTELFVIPFNEFGAKGNLPWFAGVMF